jgi:hypothetical protein
MIDEIIRLRSLGLAGYKIYELVKKKYKVTRKEVYNILRSNNLMHSTTHGGYRQKAGRGVCYNFEGITFDSFYEFLVYLYYKDKLIYLRKVLTPINTIVDGKEYNYTPDFVDVNNKYYEIKSFGDHWGWNVKKIKYFPYQLEVIHDDKLTSIKDYVINKYGQEFLTKFKMEG